MGGELTPFITSGLWPTFQDSFFVLGGGLQFHQNPLYSGGFNPIVVGVYIPMIRSFL